MQTNESFEYENECYDKNGYVDPTIYGWDYIPSRESLFR